MGTQNRNLRICSIALWLVGASAVCNTVLQVLRWITFGMFPGRVFPGLNGLGLLQFQIGRLAGALSVVAWWAVVAVIWAVRDHLDQRQDHRERRVPAPESPPDSDDTWPPPPLLRP